MGEWLCSKDLQEPRLKGLLASLMPDVEERWTISTLDNQHRYAICHLPFTIVTILASSITIV